VADWGIPPWHAAVAIPPAPLPAEADAVVVGGGFTGLSTAYHLACAGVRAVVLEADALGAGASGRTGGIVLEGTAAGALPGVDDCIATLARVTDEAAIDCDLRLVGCWDLVHVRHGGFWRDGDASLAVSETEPGGTVDPGALVAGLARAALARGAMIHEHTAVTRIEPGAVHAGERRIAARHVVVALNAYTARLVPMPVALSPALTLAVCTAPLDAHTLDAAGLAARMPFYTADLPYLWGRMTRDDGLVVGSGLVFPRDGDVGTVALAARDATAALAQLEERVRALHPALARVEIPFRWGGPIAFRNGPPILARHPDGAIVTGAYAGHGIALSVRIGQLVAAAIVDGHALPAWGALS
jgi:glycine/D-amino acid oxidase-like deaminating enzyme